jgi:hypothetical protein
VVATFGHASCIKHPTARRRTAVSRAFSQEVFAATGP